MTEVLPGNFLLADHFGLGAPEFFLRQTFRTEQFGLLQQFLLHRLDFVRGRAAIKSEVTRNQSRKILCTDVISEAELFADAQEQTRTQIAARLLNQLQRVAV